MAIQAIQTAGDIHHVTTAAAYRTLQDGYMQQAHKTVTLMETHPPVYVNGWKWCIVCAGCANRPAVGWGIACCLECGARYEGLELPVDAVEIERLLARRPKISQRSWLPNETLDDLRAQNQSIGAGI